MTTIKSPTKVAVIRRFNAAPERVFDAWLDPEMLGQWMFGPAVRDEEIVRLTTDARIGGCFSFLVRRNGQEIDHVGTYLELKRPNRLVFTWGIGEAGASRVSIEIVRYDAGCEVKLTHELHPDWADYADRTKAAWQKCSRPFSIVWKTAANS
jgi:uncharacterized protein YndB with AHSA1/START domain